MLITAVTSPNSNEPREAILTRAVAKGLPRTLVEGVPNEQAIV